MYTFKELRDHPTLTALLIISLCIALFAALYRPQSKADRLLSSCWETSAMGPHEVPCSEVPPQNRPQFMGQ